MYTDEKIKLLGTDCYVAFGLYENGTLAMTVYDAETLAPFCKPTVNWEKNWKGVGKYSLLFKPPNVVIKNYSENKGIFAELYRAGVLASFGPYMENTQGGVQISRLTPKWSKIAKSQLTHIKHTND